MLETIQETSMSLSATDIFLTSTLPDVLKTVLSLPVALIVLALIFREEIAELIPRIKKVNLPGGSSLEQTQATDGKDIDDSAEVKALLTQTKAENEAFKEVVTQQNQTLLELIDRLNLFEFNYLDTFLVLKTKAILLDLYKIGAIKKSDFFEKYPVISTIEKEAVLKALKDAFLLIENNDILHVTPRGELYLQHIQYL
ncbi:hypothetical protein A2415_03025 [candidate division WWE3 bacterium RIFOXYC1_FULL_39_7]|uniref:Uncharacterized protein n=2 Tax=Katanobacteria TaxID=422282 RepID=A0A1F4X8H4_UNCKA|nr:MAG: hypothetical protein A2415_03025 [candidate division WWE3 bacterium RIFOXYC1_FULL_39_7]OGC78005.1 MAG: hypothetical protein A2619_02880 [candidate division WWE3 bacterium RIFOXYD1_FULL_39_9]